MSKNTTTWPKSCIWPVPIDAATDKNSTDALNSLKIPAADIKNDPVIIISQIIGYRFINENLLRQAFTRRAFQIEYHLSGCSEELEFLGDSVLSLYVTKELLRHFTTLTPSDTGAPFHSQYDEGEFSRLKSRFVCKEHLAARCSALGLTPYILYGTGEERSESSREDVVEAIIGAVAIDSNYNWDVLETVIDRLIDLQIEKVDSYLKRSYYDLFNSWHHKRFGFLPEYIVEKNSQKNSAADNNFYSGIIKFCVPENDKGIWTAQNITFNGDTRSSTRECLAELAYRFVTSNGLWVNIKDSNIVPDLDKSINQLQELFQKGYIDKAEYEFSREGVKWSCSCIVNGVVGRSVNCYNKTVAKKFSSYEALILLFKASGCCKDEWFSDYVKVKNSQKDSAAKEIFIPTVNNIGLKYNGLVAILKQVPSGKVITERVLLDWLGKAYNIETLTINYKELPNVHARDNDNVPFHRFLTTKGLVDSFYKDKLIEEGHEVVETKTDNYRVLDYKDTMVDVNSLVVLDFDLAIGPEGSFFENVAPEFKDIAIKLMEENQIAKK